MPLGHRRSITVYDRVVVGSDGTPTSLYAVDRAAERKVGRVSFDDQGELDAQEALDEQRGAAPRLGPGKKR